MIILAMSIRTRWFGNGNWHSFLVRSQSWHVDISRQLQTNKQTTKSRHNGKDDISSPMLEQFSPKMGSRAFLSNSHLALCQSFISFLWDKPRKEGCRKSWSVWVERFSGHSPKSICCPTQGYALMGFSSNEWSKLCLISNTCCGANIVIWAAVSS